MVSSCIVPRCKRRRRTGLSYYRFPVKDAERCKLWLRAVKNPKYDEDTAVDGLKNHRVCSLHFRPEDFERHLVWEAMGGDGVKKLRPTAVPSLNLEHGETSTCVGRGPLQAPSTSSQTSSLGGLGTDVDTVSTRPVQSTFIPTGSPNSTSHSPPKEEVGESLCSISINHQIDTMYRETGISSALESTSEKDAGKDSSQSKTIVNDSSLMELFERCQTCGQSIVSKKVSQCGAQKRVRWSCLGGHRGMWMSSPYLWEAFPEIHLLTAFSIIFSGGTFIQFQKWAEHLHLHFMGFKTFFEIEKSYVRPEKKENKTELEIHQQPGGPSIQNIDNALCVSPGCMPTRTEQDLLKKIKSNLRRQEKRAPTPQLRVKQHQQDDVEHLGKTTQGAAEVKCLRDSFVEMEVTIKEEEDEGCSSVKNTVSTTSELLLECDEEELEPWQKQTLPHDPKDEDEVGEFTNGKVDCKSKSATPQRHATDTSPPGGDQNLHSIVSLPASSS